MYENLSVDAINQRIEMYKRQLEEYIKQEDAIMNTLKQLLIAKENRIIKERIKEVQGIV